VAVDNRTPVPEDSKLPAADEEVQRATGDLANHQGEAGASPTSTREEKVKAAQAMVSVYNRQIRQAQARLSLLQWNKRLEAGYDDYGAEMKKDAKVWKHYVEETDRTDKEMVQGWNK
jgi:hypothetical protein